MAYFFGQKLAIPATVTLVYGATTSLTKSQATSNISLHMFKTLDKDIYFK